MAKKATVTFTCRLPDDLYELLKLMSELTGHPMSQLVQQGIKELIRVYAAKLEAGVGGPTYCFT